MQLYERQFTSEYDFRSPDLDVKPYLIATSPRSGSHYIGHLLWGSGKCGVPLEYLNTANIKRWQKMTGTKSLEETFSYLFDKRSSSNGRFGIKAHWPQMRKQGRGDRLAPFLSFDRAILIYRRDRLAQAISFAIAQQTRQWISEMTAERDASYDYSSIVSCANNLRHQNNAWSRFFKGKFGTMSRRSSKVPIISVCYEDFLNSQQESYSHLLHHLLGETSTADLVPPQRTSRQNSSINKIWREKFKNEVKQSDLWVLSEQKNPLALN